MDPVPGDYILIASRIFKTDFRYFVSDVLDDVEENTHQIFRSLTEPQPSDLMAIRRFMMFCMAEQELETLLEIQRPLSPPSYPRPASPERLHKDQGRRAAIQERDRLVLGNQPIANVFDILRRQSLDAGQGTASAGQQTLGDIALGIGIDDKEPFLSLLADGGQQPRRVGLTDATLEVDDGDGRGATL